ncbi:MAG: homoserine dehydrogenase [Methylophilaceae bacterium]
MKVGLIGIGTVGGGTFKILKENAQEIFKKTGKKIEITMVADTNLALAKKIVKDEAIITSDAKALIESKNVDVVVELVGGVGISKEFVIEALGNKKHVVTANKALIAIHGEELIRLAKKNNVIFAYEAAVAGGIPIIKALREGLAANKIEWVVGIINGTTNYILTEMKENNLSFDVALKQAQELGFAEADPTFDIEGVDAAHKITILASLAFGIPINFDSVYIEGITKLTQKDIAYAEELGYRIKLLAITKVNNDEVELRVHPTLIPENRLVANVNGPMNAILVKGNMVGPTLYYGAGAGAEATASAVVADIIDIAREATLNIPTLGYIDEQILSKKVLKITNVRSEFYLRLSMTNKAGLLAQITKIFANNDVSIDAMVHKEVSDSHRDPDIFLITSKIEEKIINKIIQELESLPENKDKIIKIRVEELN